MSLMFTGRLRKLTQDELQLADSIKHKADELYAMIDLIPAGNAQRTAKNRLEEAVMWSVKAISHSD